MTKTDTAPPAHEVRDVEVRLCVPREGNRTHGDRVEDVAELAATMSGPAGLLHPIVVRPFRDGVGAPVDGFEILAGERRWRAAKQLGWARIRATVLTADDQAAVAVALIENLQRQGLHPLDELADYLKLVQLGATPATIAASTGQKVGYVQQRLALARLVPAGVKQMKAGLLPVTQAWMLARLQPADQEEALRVFGHGGMSERELSNWITQHVLRRLDGVPWELTDAKLDPKAGACAVCPKRTGAQPALFPEAGKGETCTDGRCFAGKLAATVARARGELKAKKVPFVEITTDTYSDQAGVIARGRWLPASGRERCDHSTTGLVVAGRVLADYGRSFAVCVDPACKTHRGQRSGGAGVSPAEKAKRRNDRKKAQEHDVRQVALYTAVMRRAAGLVRDGVLPVALTRWVAEQLITRLSYDEVRTLGKARGWEPVKQKYGDPDYLPAMRKELDALKAPADARRGTLLLIVSAALAPLLARSVFDVGPDELRAFARLVGVDPKAVDRQVAAAAEAKAAAKAPKKKARPAAKKS